MRCVSVWPLDSQKSRREVHASARLPDSEILRRAGDVRVFVALNLAVCKDKSAELLQTSRADPALNSLRNPLMCSIHLFLINWLINKSYVLEQASL